MKVAKLTSEIQPILVNAIMTNIESADNMPLSTLSIYLKPELVTQIVAVSDLALDLDRLETLHPKWGFRSHSPLQTANWHDTQTDFPAKVRTYNK
jgi:hypothetical protein